MKCVEFADCIASFARAFDRVGGEASHDRLLRLEAVLKLGGSASLKSVLLRAEMQATEREPVGARSVRALKSDLEAIATATEHGATKVFRDAIKLALRALSDKASMGLEDFLGQLQRAMDPAPSGWQPAQLAGETRVDAYARALDAAVHDASLFPVIFMTLKSDPLMKKADVVTIANRVVFKMPSNVTKEGALRYIWSRHQVSEDTARHVRTVGGKSAA